MNTQHEANTTDPDFYSEPELSLNSQNQPPSLATRFHVLDKIGSGMESIVYKVQEDVRIPIDADKQAPPVVAKTRNKVMHHTWRPHPEILYPRCVDALVEEDVPHIQTEIHDRAVLIWPGGKETKHSTVLVSPFVPNVNIKAINYAKLLDPETGLQTQREIVDIIEKAHAISQKYELGMDAFGLSALGKIIATVPKALLRKIVTALPKNTPGRDFFLERSTGENVHIENLIVHTTQDDSRTVKLVDIGMLNLQKGPKIRSLMEVFYELTMGGLIATIERANIDLAAQEGREPDPEIIERLAAIKREKIETARFKSIPEIYQWFTTKMMALLSPILIKYIEDTPKRETAIAEKKQEKAARSQARKESIQRKIDILKHKRQEIAAKITTLIEQDANWQKHILKLAKKEAQITSELNLLKAT